MPSRFLWFFAMMLLGNGWVQAEQQRIWSFEDAKLGTCPEEWDIAETGGAGVPAVWEVIEAENAPDGKRVFAITSNRNRSRVGNLALSKSAAVKNIELSTYIKAGPAGGETAGGLVWRAVDENHYYLAQWNANDGHLRLYVYVGGKPSLLESVSLQADTNAWHQMSVTHFEKSIEISFDGESLIAIEDMQLDFPGWIGLWAPGSAMPRFDGVNLFTEDEEEGE